MKFYYFFWVLMLQNTEFFSQSSHFAEHGMRDKVSNVVCVNQKAFYLERAESYYGQSNLNFVGVKGAVIFKQNLLQYSDYYWTGKIITTLDKQLACVYRSFVSCDQIGGWSIFTKLDTNGTIVFSHTVNASYLSPISPLALIDLMQHQDSSYYLISQSEIHHYSKNGQFIAKQTMSLGTMQSISRLQSGNIFINTSTTNYVLNTALATIQSFPTLENIKKLIHSPSSKIYALNQNSRLLRYQSNFTILNQSQTGAFRLSDFVCRNDSVFAVGTSSATGEPYYCILDSNLNLLFQTSNSLKGIYPQGIALDSKNEIHVVAQAHNESSNFPTSYGNTMNYRAYFQMPLLGNYSIQKDVGVTGYTFLNPLVKIFAMTYVADLEIELKNFGNQAVNSCYVNSRFSPLCFGSRQLKVDTLINPGATIKFKTGPIQVSGEGVEVNGKIKLCFYTSVPDSTADSDPMNDWYCDSVQISAVGVQELKDRVQSILIFPNPFTTSFAFLSEFVITEVKVFNALGEVVLSQTAAGKEGSIDMHNFKEGIYFVSVETEKGTVTKKLMKQ